MTFVLTLMISFSLSIKLAKAQCAGCHITNPTTTSNFAWHNRTVCYNTSTTTSVGNVNQGNCTIKICNGATVTLNVSASLFLGGCSLNCVGTLNKTGAGSYTGPGSGSCALPVFFNDISAQREDGAVYVQWSTAMELNNEFFVIQRSTDGTNWSNIDTVEGNGNSKELIRYSYVDIYPLRGPTVYRIQQFDFDGQNDYSDAVAISKAGAEEVHIYPNPATWTLNFDQTIENPSKMEISTTHGIVTSETFEDDVKLNNVDISMLSTGSYLISITNNNGTFTKKFIKK